MHYDSTFKEAIKLLKGTDTIIWMTLRETAVKGDHDAEAVKVVQEIADLAQKSGVRVALYGHAGFYVATANDAVRIVKLANRPNVGATITSATSSSPRTATGWMTRSRRRALLDSRHHYGVDVKNKQYLLRLDQGDLT